MRRLLFILVTLCLLYGGVANAALPRFIDLQDGTVIDTVSSLRWLKNANCFGASIWPTAMSSASNLASGQCGLNDDSSAGDWRLPTIAELRISTDAGYRNDTLNSAGFSNVQSSDYWSSSDFVYNGYYKAYHDNMGYGIVGESQQYGGNFYAWPVRSGQWNLDSLKVYGLSSVWSYYVGQTSTRQIALFNSGTTSLSVTSVNLTGTNADQFSVALGGVSPCSSNSPTLAAGEICTLSLQTTYTSTGNKVANVSIVANAKTLDIPLTGNGTTTTIPGSPTNVTATAEGIASATVSFNAPDSNGGSPITSYQVTSSPGNIIASGTASPITVTGLIKDTAYTFTVTATNALGTGQASSASSTVILSSRFVEQQNGTILDTLNNLFWLKKANCFGEINDYGQGAVVATNNLASGQCGLTDNSVIGDWYLPTATDLLVFKSAGYTVTTLNAYGFSNITPGSGGSTYYYWSSDNYTDILGNKYYNYVDIFSGNVQYSGSFPASNQGVNVWPVRIGNTIRGTVTDLGTGTKLSGVSVSINGGSSTTTDSNGAFVFNPAPAFGTYSLSFSKVGYQTITQSNLILDASNYPRLNVSLVSVPGAPNNVTAGAGKDQATVSFAPPTNNGGSAITGYIVTSSPGNITATASASPIIVTGLTGGTVYTFTVTATNSAGTGPASSSSNTVTPSIPTAPTGVNATPGNTNATVAFNAPDSDGGYAITAYTVKSSPGNKTASGTASPISVTGLNNGTAYTFTVTATNSVANGPASSASNSVYVGAPPKLFLTGQTTSYAPGDDGDLQFGLSWPSPRFTINMRADGVTANGTVTDNMTGMIWLKNASCFGWMTRAAANTAVGNIMKGDCGLTDGSSSYGGTWRLPNRRELISLLNREQPNPGTWLNGAGFDNVQLSIYLTSSSEPDGTPWSVHMDSGNVVDSTSGYVLPVMTGSSALLATGQTTIFTPRDDGAERAGASWPYPRFADLNNGSVFDNATGLIWLKNIECFGTRTWTNAVSTASSLASGACGLTDGSVAGDWIIPNANQLESLVDLSKTGPPLPQGHPFTNSNDFFTSSNDFMYWTSGTAAANTNFVWAVDMYYGYVVGQANTSLHYVWPVRSGQFMQTDGICGSSNATSFTIAPTSNLCSAGTASAVTGSGSWSWTCKGTYGGANAYCATSPPPNITAFTLPDTQSLLTVTFTNLSGSSSTTAYLVSEQSTKPQAGDANWTTVKPSSYTFATYGAKTLYVWAKDKDGGLSNTAASAYIQLTESAAIVTSFTVPDTGFSLTVPITAFTGSSNTVAYLVSESATAPSAADANWKTVAPANFTMTGYTTHTLQAWVKNASGAVSSSASATTTLSQMPTPVLTVSTLADGSFTNNNTLNITGTVARNPANGSNPVAGLTINGQTITLGQNGSFSTAIPLTAGSNTIIIVAADTLSYSTTDSRTITMDTAAPVLTVTIPADNSSTSQSLATISGTIDETSTINFTVNGSSPQSASINGSTFSAIVNLVSGLNTIDITATDLASNTSSAKRTVTLDITAPSLTVTDPSQDGSTSQNSITLGGTVTDTVSSATVTITADGQTYTPTVAQDGSFSQSIPLPTDKTYAVVVAATDLVGNSATVQRNIIKSTPLSQPTISDALKVLQAIVGITPLTASEQVRYDVAPLGSNGSPLGNGTIDAADMILILRRSIGIGSW